MSSGLEAAGDLATGVIVADTVEPGHGTAADGAHGGCANCGTALVGAYCHACGQNGHIHRSLAGFGHDLLHGVFHFEGKFWTTLPMLFFKPGELTRRYIAGERAKFVSPMALFLFCVFVMFAVFGSMPSEHANNVNMNTRVSEARSAAEPTRGEAQPSSNRVVGADDLEVRTNWPWLTNAINTVRENPGLFTYRLQSTAYKYSWTLIPISTPLIWLLFFWRREFKLYDHLIFATFSLSFMMMLMTAVSVLAAIGVPGSLLVLITLAVPPLHMYRQLRGAYQTSRAGALVRTGALLVLSVFALILYLAALLAMGLMH